MANEDLFTVVARGTAFSKARPVESREKTEAGVPKGSPARDQIALRDNTKGYFSTRAHVSNWLRTVVGATPIASVVSDPRLPDNPIIALNQAFVDLTGYDPHEALDQNCRFLSGSRTEPWLSEKIREGVRDHRPVLVEILNYRKCGTAFRNAVLVAPIYDEEDELCYFLGSQTEIVENDQPISESRHERAVACLERLSPRQFEVAQLVAKGFLNKQIADTLGLSEKTIKMHRGLLMKKLKLATQADLIRLAVEAGI